MSPEEAKRELGFATDSGEDPYKPEVLKVDKSDPWESEYYAGRATGEQVGSMCSQFNPLAAGPNIYDPPYAGDVLLLPASCIGHTSRTRVSASVKHC